MVLIVQRHLRNLRFKLTAFLFCPLIAWLVFTSAAQSPATSTGIDSIRAEDLRPKLTYFASEKFKGRGNGTPELDMAAEKMALLGRAASTVGHEMKGLLRSLMQLAQQNRGLQCTEVDHDFKIELRRIERMVEILSSFVPEEQIQMLSKDLNEIVLERIKAMKDKDMGYYSGVELE